MPSRPAGNRTGSRSLEDRAFAIVPSRRLRLDALLVERGYFRDAASAGCAVMEGRIGVEGLRDPKPGALVREHAAITVSGSEPKYASRGGFKLEAALEAFGVAVNGRVVLDAGASAGGFTDCLLQRGAARIYALDVGYGQLRGRLAADRRVVSWERTNISDVSRADFHPAIDLCVFDLSYLSVAVSLPILARLFEGPPDLIGLIKPLYEQVERSSMQDETALRGVLVRVAESARAADLSMSQVVASPILGSNGAVEFLARFQAEPGCRSVTAHECDRAIAVAVALCGSHA
jgi:23S rRNA (cytidine1920-2'-O)/16S rRNA (cytidine1409-2'-O)-methyltransferase